MRYLITFRSVVIGLLLSLSILIPRCRADGEMPKSAPAERTVDAARIDRLIRQLGNAQFAEREAASRALDGLGELALPALRKAQDNSDLEVRRRVAALIKILMKRRAPKRIEAWSIFTRCRGDIHSDTGTPDGIINDIWLDAATWVEDEDLAMLQWLDETRGLVLRGLPITDAGLVHVKRLYRLRSLELGSTKVSNAGLANLTELGTLAYLGLCDTQITDDGLKHLTRLPNLLLLELSHTQITDAGLEYVKGLKRLKSLNLNHTRITDAGITRLKELEHLQTLFVEKTRVTQQGVADLQKALPNLKHVRH